jgi:hypothetical protein
VFRLTALSTTTVSPAGERQASRDIPEHWRREGWDQAGTDEFSLACQSLPPSEFPKRSAVLALQQRPWEAA